MKNIRKFIEQVYDEKNKRPLRHYFKTGAICINPKLPLQHPFYQRRLQILTDLLASSGNYELDESEMAIVLACVMLIVKSDFVETGIPFEERLKDFHAHHSCGMTEYFDFTDPRKVEHFFHIAEQIIEEQGTFDMFQLLSDMLNWNKDDSVKNQWKENLYNSNTQESITLSDNECSYGLSIEERNCRECSLSNYGLDCHNNPIN